MQCNTVQCSTLPWKSNYSFISKYSDFQDLDLDLLVEATNAPGLSDFNKAERRMFHLSKQMTGVVLPHDTFGSHLRNGKTVDEELEKKNCW